MSSLFHDTYLRAGADELVLHGSSVIVETNFGLEITMQKAFSIGIIEMHPVLLVRKVLLPSNALARWSSKRGRWEAILVVEAIREVAIAAKSIILPHEGDLSGVLVEGDGDASSGVCNA